MTSQLARASRLRMVASSQGGGGGCRGGGGAEGGGGDSRLLTLTNDGSVVQAINAIIPFRRKRKLMDYSILIKVCMYKSHFKNPPK